MALKPFLYASEARIAGAWQGTRRALRDLRGSWSHCLSRMVDETALVLKEEKGQVNLADVKKVCLYAHYDRDSRVEDYVLNCIQELSKLGYGVVFVTVSRHLTAESIERLAPFCAWIVHRKNRGWDFGSWKVASRFTGPLESYDEVVLANDSVYGPVKALGPIFEKMGKNEAALWGITDSWMNRYHVQSYFAVLRKSYLALPAFKTFWENIRFVRDRYFVVSRYEMGLTQTAIRAGLPVAVLCPYGDAVKAGREKIEARYAKLVGAERYATRLPEAWYCKKVLTRCLDGIPMDPMHFFWDALIDPLGCPFIKRELLSRNPMAVPNVNEWEPIVRAASSYDTQMIHRHLQRIVRQRSPC
ncbi:MAG: hypothetical protein A3K19_18105 [Lentisphaerae bacterium RIFOXYB12_FULL_65_16]|nr:MAG: hypothetical protein A3K18_12580 [Lentisphaerae bacterium RIFOXYA12_64_32]OGV87092.1 MAG: hypothetical protein A3K19_18105 [Lentisphaerae bacterium RIFOXYB12_FULL_65_16]